jgi:hypothetical protein
LKVGITLFVLSIILPVAGISAVAAIDLSTTVTATASGVLLFGAKILGIVAITIMGQPGYTYIKAQVFGFLKRHGPPETVSSLRYRIGLAMFCLPIIFAWASIYISAFIPGFDHNPVAWALGGDILLVTSLFVLGGNFWDKIRALFVYDAQVSFLQ